MIRPLQRARQESEIGEGAQNKMAAQLTWRADALCKTDSGMTQTQTLLVGLGMQHHQG